MEKGDVQLGNKKVVIVPRVGNYGRSIIHSWHINFVSSEAQKVRISRIIKERVALWSRTIDRIKFERGCSKIPDGSRIVFPFQGRRRIKCEVVIDKLPEIGKACWDSRVPTAITNHRTSRSAKSSCKSYSDIF